MPIPIRHVQAILLPYGLHADEDTCHKINIYIDLLTLWNRKMALTAVATPEEILRFHFGESVFVLDFCGFERGRLADVGSGAGFPGLALRIFRPQLGVALIEPSKKKSVFLAEVVRSLDLSDVEIIPRRFEDSEISPDSLDFVTSRALAQTHALISWSARSLKDGGHLIFWLSEDSAAKIQRIGPFLWDRPIKIPGAKYRSILIGRKSPER